MSDYDGLASLIKNGKVDCVVVSTRRLDAERLDELKHLCVEYGVRLSRLQFDFQHLVDRT